MRMDKINRILIKIDRICAFFLLLILILFIFSGYGMERGIFDFILSKKIHSLWLPIPFFFCFLFHSLVQIKFTLIRWGAKDDLFLNLILLFFFLVLLFLFLYLQLC
ncbi:hypothetical protein H5T58_03060 [Candidatus Parcubacteria bacterium]|nr:hypothetical protein [Candidatus Parcubacteria bacterium]